MRTASNHLGNAGNVSWDVEGQKLRLLLSYVIVFVLSSILPTCSFSDEGRSCPLSLYWLLLDSTFGSFKLLLSLSIFVSLQLKIPDIHKDFSRDDPEGSCERVVRINRSKNPTRTNPSPRMTPQGKKNNTNSAIFSQNHGARVDVHNKELTMVNVPTGTSSSGIQYYMMNGGVSSWMVWPMTTTSMDDPYTELTASSLDMMSLSSASSCSENNATSASGYSGSSHTGGGDDHHDDDDDEPISLDSSDVDGLSDPSRCSTPTSMATLYDFLNDYPPETLEKKWMIDGLQEYEPRTIEQMVATPNIWYNYCPSLSPEQQFIAEYFMPITLPMAFYVAEITWWGHLYAWALIVGHSLQTVCTNFGGKSWYYVDIVGTLQHVALDQIWNHVNVSLFILLGPPVFGPYCKILAIVLVTSRTVFLLCDIKSHFLTNIRGKASSPNLPLSGGIGTSGDDPVTSTAGVTKNEHPSRSVNLTTAQLYGPVADVILEYQLGRHIRLTCAWYTLASTLLVGSVAMDNIPLQVLAVTMINLGPIIVDVSYGQRFSSLLQSLPPNQRTVVREGTVLLPHGLLPWLLSSSLKKTTPRTSTYSSWVQTGKQKMN